MHNLIRRMQKVVRRVRELVRHMQNLIRFRHLGNKETKNCKNGVSITFL